MKKKIIISVIATAFILLLFVFVNNKPKETYQLIPIKNVELLSTLIQDSDETYIYFGRPTCPDCANFSPLLEGELKSAKVNAYYFNTDVFRSDPEFNNVITMFDVDWVPAFYKVGRGHIIDKFDLQLERNPDENSKNKCELQLKDFLF